MLQNCSRYEDFVIDQQFIYLFICHLMPLLSVVAVSESASQSCRSVCVGICYLYVQLVSCLNEAC
jgi:hypothetical protein